jgi:hypothetical protein
MPRLARGQTLGKGLVERNCIIPHPGPKQKKTPGKPGVSSEIGWLDTGSLVDYAQITYEFCLASRWASAYFTSGLCGAHRLPDRQSLGNGLHLVTARCMLILPQENGIEPLIAPKWRDPHTDAFS